MSVTSYIQDHEWTMGNGQCWDCCGAPESWFGHPCYMRPELIGHNEGCRTARFLAEDGGSPLMKGDFQSDVRWVNCVVQRCITTRTLEDFKALPMDDLHDTALHDDSMVDLKRKISGIIRRHLMTVETGEGTIDPSLWEE